MRKASVVLAIIGCVFSFLLGMFLVFGGTLFSRMLSQIDMDEVMDAYETMYEYENDDMIIMNSDKMELSMKLFGNFYRSRDILTGFICFVFDRGNHG